MTRAMTGCLAALTLAVLMLALTPATTHAQQYPLPEGAPYRYWEHLLDLCETGQTGMYLHTEGSGWCEMDMLHGHTYFVVMGLCKAYSWWPGWNSVAILHPELIFNDYIEIFYEPMIMYWDIPQCAP